MDGQTKRPTWYSGRYTKLLGRPQDLLKDGNIWAKKVANPDIDDQPTPDDLAVNTEDIYTMKKEDLDYQLDRLCRQVDTELENVRTSHVALKSQRARGVRKVSANAQGFLSDFSTFLTSYSGIVEIVKSADSQFGGLAWGTLSVFLSVAVLKQEREDEINRAILEFSRHCPRLRILKEIYPDEDLQRHIAEMYTSVIQFARSATLFYQRGSLRRIVSSSNPREKVSETIQVIQTGLVNIRRDCEALMQQRVYELSKQAESLKEELARVNRSLERTDHDRNVKHMTKLRERLQIPNGLSTSSFSYRSLLASAVFQQQSRGATYPTVLTNNKLEEDAVVNRWLQDIDTGILFLSGKNAAWVNQTTLNWLSQASVLMMERFREEGKYMAYVFCQTKSLLAEKDKPLIRSVFAYLALQLLEKRAIDRQRIDSDIESTISGDHWNSDDEYDTIQAGTRLINKALHTFGNDETVYLVIDRVDQCRWPHDTEMMRLGVCDVLDSLLSLVLTAPCKLKILVVSASTSHNRDLWRSIARRHDPASMDRLLQRIDWDQDLET
ncbi:Nn.00g027080.m01.CDS01 [Neocucurbitaria sp. VM-36]